MLTLQAEYEQMDMPEINGNTITANPIGISEREFLTTSFFNIQQCSAGRAGVSGFIGFKMVFKASDLVNLQINQPSPISKRIRGNWRLV